MRYGKKAICGFVVLLLSCSLVDGAEAIRKEELQEKIKNALLRHIEFEERSRLKQIKGLQRRTEATDVQVGRALKDIIQNKAGQADKNRIAWELAKRAIRLVPDFSPAPGSRKLLKSLIKNNERVRHASIESYIRLTDARITNLIKQILKNEERYDEMDRYYVYDDFITSHKKAKDEKKQRRILSFLHNSVKKESEQCNFGFLDRFLVEHKEGYKKSKLRKSLVEDFYKKRPGNETPYDKYITQALKEVSGKTTSN